MLGRMSAFGLRPRPKIARALVAASRSMNSGARRAGDLVELPQKCELVHTLSARPLNILVEGTTRALHLGRVIEQGSETSAHW